MALALLNYQETHGQMPPAVVYGKDGKPLYSWRVLLLPFIEQQGLYERFRLDEPWDSPHNIRLLEEMPSTYAPPSGKQGRVPPHHTVVHVFVGQGAAFEGRQGLNVYRDFPDGSSNTILLIEAGEPVPWSSPADLPFEPYGPLPELNLLFDDGFRVALADGSVRWLKLDISEPTLRAAITRNGGETLGADW